MEITRCRRSLFLETNQALGGVPCMTSAPKGEGGSGKADKGTGKLREWDSDKGDRGGQKIRNFCRRHKLKPPHARTVQLSSSSLSSLLPSVVTWRDLSAFCKHSAIYLCFWVRLGSRNK